MLGIPPKQVRSCFLDDPQLRAEVVEVTGIGADNAPHVHSPETQFMFTLNGAYYFCADGRESLIDTHQVGYIRSGLISKDRGVADGSATLLLITPAPELLEHIFGVPMAKVGALHQFLHCIAPICGKTVLGAQQLGYWATRVDDALALAEAAIALLRDVAARGEVRDLPGPRPARLINATKEVLAERDRGPEPGCARAARVGKPGLSHGPLQAPRRHLACEVSLATAPPSRLGEAADKRQPHRSRPRAGLRKPQSLHDGIPSRAWRDAVGIPLAGPTLGRESKVFASRRCNAWLD